MVDLDDASNCIGDGQCAAGNAVEGPDGRVHVLLRMPVHLPESKVDLNHACMLTWAPGPTRLARYQSYPTTRSCTKTIALTSSL